MLRSPASTTLFVAGLSLEGIVIVVLAVDVVVVGELRENGIVEGVVEEEPWEKLPANKAAVLLRSVEELALA